ncbi:histidinol-phosphate transaminase [Insolitispirillum peregrinum]|uniref:histidinol-phosphate transaminase n=1 Tax=Insolitispirillum peregrinum TaxID=80876 RepID=UPI00361B5498
MSLPTPQPGILDIAAYVGGESSVKGVERIYKLSSNEGALGPSPKAQAALVATAGKLHRYPDGGSTELRKAIAARYGLDPTTIVCGAGSDELIGLLVKAYAGPGDEVLYSEHGFLMYGIYAKGCSAVPVTAPERNLCADVDALLAAVTDKTKLVFVTNPSNPTGTYTSAEDLARLRAALPSHVLLVIDAAYAEYVDRNDYTTGLELAQSTPNTVMLRTFSKLHALGGARVGWGVFPPAIADVMNRLRSPFNLTSSSQAAARAAIEDVEFQALCKTHNDYWLPWMKAELKALGLHTTDSVANFVLVQFPADGAHSAKAAHAFLQNRGLIVRPVGSYGLPEWLRITIGTGEENQMVIAALKDFLGAGS